MKTIILLIFSVFFVSPIFAQKQKVWLDADTGNEMDDLYAIVRLVKEPAIELVGLSSAHFNNPDLLVFEKWNAYESKGLNTVAESQRLNEQILKALGRLDIPHPIGADRQIGRAWGQQDPRDSEAAQAIIKAVKNLPEGEILDILTIGAMTNLASALILAPEIKSKIRCFALGAQYDPKTKIWNKNEFNIRNDLNAFDFLLNLEGLDLTMMCLQAALPLQFKRDDTYARLNEADETEKILEDRWREQNPQDETRVMWDLALVEAYLRPDLTKIETVTTPPENQQRTIKAYVKIDEKALADDFWRVLKIKLFSLHPENPNYFLYNGKPTILVTSGEHYGAVMNADFDYEKYLLTLKKEGLNYTRIFLGPYSEIGDNLFGIINNTMNPKPESWVTPWIKDPSSGKYDLNQWNDAFFSRLKGFVSAASENGIVVEVTLFTSYYTNHQWKTSPFNPKNNIQQFDSISFKQVNTINNGQLMQIQEKYVRKVVQELNAFGNIFLEIQNEPWSDNPNLVEKISETDTITHPFTWQKLVETAKSESLEWQKRIVQIIADEESNLPNKHLIAQNISNFRGKIENQDPNISIFNFHYAYPVAASENLGLKKAIGLDETGFMPKVDFHYRSQAWKFMLAGGALYNNLDYSFIVGKEDGTHSIDAGTPGWGHREYRKQLKIMKDFIESFDFVRMKPDNSILQVVKGKVAEFQVLAESGKQYAIYLDKASLAEIRLQLSDGNYTAEWVNTLTGSINRKENLTAQGGAAMLICPEFQEDIVLRILKTSN